MSARGVGLSGKYSTRKSQVYCICHETPPQVLYCIVHHEYTFSALTDLLFCVAGCRLIIRFALICVKSGKKISPKDTGPLDLLWSVSRGPQQGKKSSTRFQNQARRRIYSRNWKYMNIRMVIFLERLPKILSAAYKISSEFY